MQTSSLRFKKHPKGVFIITRMQTSSIYEKLSATEWTCLCFLIRKSMKELSGMEGSPKRDVPIQVLIGNVHQNVWTWQEFLDQHQTPLHSLIDYCRKPAAQIKRNDLTESVGETAQICFYAVKSSQNFGKMLWISCPSAWKLTLQRQSHLRFFLLFSS